MDKIYDLARFMAETGYRDLPEETVRYAKTLFLDILSTTIAGSTADACAESASVVLEWKGKPESTVLLYGKRIPAPNAAFINGVMAHARDYDDTYDEATIHTGVSVIPSCLAAAEAKGVDGKTLLASIVLSVEIFSRLALSIKASITESGWIYSALCGYFACAAGAAKVMGLGEAQIANAMGIVYSQAAGTHQVSTDAALTKRMQPGFAAKSGVFSAYLAQAGITGVQNVLEGEAGFYPLYLRNRYDIEILTRNLGKTYEIGNLAFKPYPCCRLTHTSIDAARKLAVENRITPEEIREITVEVSDTAWHAVCQPLELRRKPDHVVRAQFSIPYAVATVIVKGSVRLEDYTKEGIKNPEVLKLAQKVTPIRSDELNRRYGRGVAPAIVTIYTPRGAYSATIEFSKGHPKNPLSHDDMMAKLRDAIKYSLYPVKEDSLDQALSLVNRMEDLEDINELTNAISNAFITV